MHSLLKQGMGVLGQKKHNRTFSHHPGTAEGSRGILSLVCMSTKFMLAYHSFR